MAFGEAFPSVLLAARVGAEWAWTALYRDLAPPVLGYLRGTGAADPEDLTGEVFLRVVRDLARFEGGEADFRSWIFTIAHHRLLDQRRSRSRRPEDLAPADEVAGRVAGGDVEGEALERLATAEVRRVIERRTRGTCSSSGS